MCLEMFTVLWSLDSSWHRNSNSSDHYLWKIIRWEYPGNFSLKLDNLDRQKNCWNFLCSVMFPFVSKVHSNLQSFSNEISSVCCSKIKTQGSSVACKLFVSNIHSHLSFITSEVPVFSWLLQGTQVFAQWTAQLFILEGYLELMSKDWWNWKYCFVFQDVKLFLEDRIIGPLNGRLSWNNIPTSFIVTPMSPTKLHSWCISWVTKERDLKVWQSLGKEIFFE